MMDKMNIVKPKYIEGWNMSIAQIFGSGPKLTITCGVCEGTFKKRIPMINNPGVYCPYCNTINKIPMVIE